MRISILKTSLLGAFAAFASSSFAGTYGTAGCGLGSIVFGADRGFVQVFAATTNGTSGSQTFGISSGTSNCVPSAKSEAFNNQREFISNNITVLAKEAAQGDGETLRAFASTLGCNSGAYADVAKTLQAKHSAVFAEPGTDAILFATHEVLRENANVVSNCKDLI